MLYKVIYILNLYIFPTFRGFRITYWGVLKMDNALKNILLIIAIIVVLAVGVAAIYFVASSNDTIGDFVNVDDNTDNQVEDDRFDELDQANQDLLDQIEALRKEREDALEEIRNQQNQDSTN